MQFWNQLVVSFGHVLPVLAFLAVWYWALQACVALKDAEISHSHWLVQRLSPMPKLLGKAANTESELLRTRAWLRISVAIVVTNIVQQFYR